MVGRWISFQNCICSGAMLVSGRVPCVSCYSTKKHIWQYLQKACVSDILCILCLHTHTHIYVRHILPQNLALIKWSLSKFRSLLQKYIPWVWPHKQIQINVIGQIQNIIPTPEVAFLHILRKTSHTTGYPLPHHFFGIFAPKRQVAVLWPLQYLTLNRNISCRQLPGAHQLGTFPRWAPGRCVSNFLIVKMEIFHPYLNEQPFRNR